MSDNNETQTTLNPEIEALCALVAAIDNYTSSLIKLGHLIISKDLDADFKADVKGTAHLIAMRFNQEITGAITASIEPSKRGQIVWPQGTMKQ